MEPKDDGNPQDGPGTLKPGFNRLARDLDRAFALARLNGYEAVVLQAVRELSWTLPAIKASKAMRATLQPAPVKLNLGRLAKQTKLDRTGLWRALDKLVAARILRLDRGGRVAINKDYRRWVNPAVAAEDDPHRRRKPAPETPRFDPDQLAWILAAKRIGKSGRDDRDESAAVAPGPRSGVAPGQQSDCAAVAPAQQACCPGEAPAVAPGQQRNSSPPDPLIWTAPVGESLERGRDSLRSSLPERGCGGEGGAVGPLTHEGPDGEVRPVRPQVRNDPAEVGRVAALAEAWFPMRDFDRNVKRYAVLYPIAWIERSLGISASYADPPATFTPVYNRLRAWERAGGPPPEPPAAPARRTRAQERQATVLDGLDDLDAILGREATDGRG